MSKISFIILIFVSVKIIRLGVQLMIYQFLITSFFEVVYFLKLGPILAPHTQVNASPITKITSWLKFLGKNLHLVGCATLCTKSEVMLIHKQVTPLKLMHCVHKGQNCSYFCDVASLTFDELNNRTKLIRFLSGRLWFQNYDNTRVLKVS